MQNHETTSETPQFVTAQPAFGLKKVFFSNEQPEKIIKIIKNDQ